MSGIKVMDKAVETHLSDLAPGDIFEDDYEFFVLCDVSEELSSLLDGIVFVNLGTGELVIGHDHTIKPVHANISIIRERSEYARRENSDV